MPSVRTDVLDIAYHEYGDPAGPPVLLLHGWPDAARGWRAVGSGLAAAGWRVIAPDNRGSGGTTFLAPDTPRDGQGPALAQDALDLADALGIDRFAVVGHDWGARAGYTIAALWPARLTALAALALAYQPRGQFVMPDFGQAQRFWYQWLLYVDAGADAVRRDPAGFALRQWQTWSPPGWYDAAEFAATSQAFAHPDWVDISLNAYRSHFRDDEPHDPRYDELRRRLDATDHVTVPTLMIQGAVDSCDPPALSEGLDGHFDVYHRLVLEGAGHFPLRERPAEVTAAVLSHLSEHAREDTPDSGCTDVRQSPSRRPRQGGA